MDEDRPATSQEQEAADAHAAMEALMQLNTEGRLYEPPEVGATLGDSWKLTRWLGSGGFGHVYEAWDIELERTRAIKILDPARASEQMRVAFLTEARLMSKLEGKHLVEVFFCGRLPEGTPFFVMEMIRGGSLRAALGRGLAPDDAMEIAEELLVGLALVHERGYVHGDLKPENILLSEHGARVRIVDFGLARKMAAIGGTVAGTPPYMAPEILLDGREPTVGTDLFAVAVMLYEMLTGELPRGHVSMGLDEMRDSWRRRPDIDALRLAGRAGITDALERLMAQALSTDPDERPPSANAMLERLRAARPGPRVATDSPTPASSSVDVRWILLAVVALLAGVVVWLVLRERTEGPSSPRVPAAAALEEPSAEPRPVEAPQDDPAVESSDTSDGSGPTGSGSTGAASTSPVDAPASDERPPSPKKPQALTRARFDRTIRSLDRAIEECARKTDVFPGTEVTVRVTVDASGSAVATVGGAEARLPIGTCIRDVVQRKRFDRTRDGGAYDHTFRLRGP
ncbi:MAG: protein kinase [Myxococcota bacterium]